MIFSITNGSVTVTGDFPICLGDRRCDLMRVEIAASLGVDKTDGVTITRVAELLLWLVLDISAIGVEEPVVVCILMMIASDLLLLRTVGVSLMMRVKQTTSIPHVLQCSAGAVSNFKWAIFADLGTSKVHLEKRAHLCVSWTAVLENKEVNEEGEHVHRNRNEDQSEDTETHMCC